MVDTVLQKRNFQCASGLFAQIIQQGQCKSMGGVCRVLSNMLSIVLVLLI